MEFCESKIKKRRFRTVINIIIVENSWFVNFLGKIRTKTFEGCELGALEPVFQVKEG